MMTFISARHVNTGLCVPHALTEVSTESTERKGAGRTAGDLVSD